MKYCIVQMDTERRSWLAMGRTLEEANAALLKAYNDAQKSLAACGYKVAEPFDTVEELDSYYGIYDYYLEPGECLNW